MRGEGKFGITIGIGIEIDNQRSKSGFEDSRDTH